MITPNSQVTFNNPQLQAILHALTAGSLPMGNQSLMPIMEGLGAQKQWVKGASPAQTQNASVFGIMNGRQG